MNLFSKFRALFRKEKLDADMNEEMRQHLERRAEANLAAGMSAEEARYAARRQFGGLEQLKEIAREQRTRRWLDPLIQDLRYGLRALRRNPGFAAVAILTLALGIGANTAIFTAVNAMILRPLPVPEAHRLVYAASNRSERFSYPSYERLRDQTKAFPGVSAVQEGVKRRAFAVSGSAEVESVATQLATGNYFNVLAVPPLLGRAFDPVDDRPGAAQPVIVISHAFWQRRFGGDSSVVGQVVRVADVPVTILGVMPKGFAGFQVGLSPDVWAPLQLGSQWDAGVKASLAYDSVAWLILFGRLRDGVTREQAQAEVQLVLRQQLEERIGLDPGMSQPARERMLSQTFALLPGAAGYVSLRSQFRQPLAILMATVGIVLLIACANVAGLLLARGASRRREFALRAALGAGQGRIFRQLLTESVLLAALGGAAGLVFAYWGTEFLARFLAASGSAFELRPGGRVLLFMIAMSLLTGVVFGFFPALQLSRINLVSAIKEQGVRAGRTSRGLQPTLVVVQIFLSVVLLAGAGLLIQTLHNLRTRDLGFRPENVVSFTVSPKGWQPGFEEMNVLLRRVFVELETLRGVRSVAIGGGGILSGNAHISTFSIDGYVPAPDEEMRASVVLAGPRFFETLKVPLRGREFQLSDEPVPTAANPNPKSPVAIISESLARKFFGTADPVGRFVTLKAGAGMRLEVVGVAGDTKYGRDLREAPPLEIYQPFFGARVFMQSTFYLRTEQSAAGLVPDLRALLARVDPRLEMGSARVLDDVIDRLVVRERVIAHLVGFFSAFALFLASLGIYGMLSYGVTQRTREIGMRMALGATWHNVLALVLREGLGLTVIGSALGILGATLLGRFIEAQLYGVKPIDPLTLAAVAGIFIAVALFACWLPARRAAKVDPMAALRAE